MLELLGSLRPVFGKLVAGQKFKRAANNGRMAFKLFSGLHYIAHGSNLKSMLQRGILSRGTMVRAGIFHVDISDQSVQRWRARKEPVFGRAIHDYVPLYFNPRNPMLYSRRSMQHELVILTISPAAVRARGHILFTDGNAASACTSFSPDTAVVRASRPALRAPCWHNVQDGTRRRCSEALRHARILPRYIVAVACNNECLATQLRRETGFDVQVDASFFF